MSTAVWIGADPGGKGTFGVAILRPDATFLAACVACAAEAVEFVSENCTSTPSGVGVDAPLWWSAGPSGDRQADQWLRRRYRLSGGQVQTSNSLRGAALVQGALFVSLIRTIYPAIPVTESHPKALLRAVAGNTWSEFCARFNLRCGNLTDHLRDAIVGAVAAREGFEGRWTHDLGVDRGEYEQDPLISWLGPVHYWPER